VQIAETNGLDEVLTQLTTQKQVLWLAFTVFYVDSHHAHTDQAKGAQTGRRGTVFFEKGKERLDQGRNLIIVFDFIFIFVTECTQTSKAQTGTISKSDKSVAKSKPDSSKAAKEDKPAKKQANTVTKAPIKSEPSKPESKKSAEAAKDKPAKATAIQPIKSAQPAFEQDDDDDGEDVPLTTPGDKYGTSNLIYACFVV
jgi:hypothetical protein